MDYNVTEKHHIEFVYNYQTNIRRPDGVNVGTASPIFPGTGNVLNGTEFGNQGGIAFSAVAALRSTLTPRLVSEIRFGLVGGTVIFNNGINPGDFAQWQRLCAELRRSMRHAYVTSPFRTTGQTRRNTPLKQGNVNLTYSHVRAPAQFRRQLHPGQHLDHLGQRHADHSDHRVRRGHRRPDHHRRHQHLHRRQFPRRQRHRHADQRAGALRAAHRPRLRHQPQRGAGRRDQDSTAPIQPIVRNQQREFGLYFQDSWRVHPRLTFNYGVRWDRQNPPVNLNGVYTRPGYAGVWGVSGVGNLFKPGVLTGQAPVFNAAARAKPASTSATSSSRRRSDSPGRCPKPTAACLAARQERQASFAPATRSTPSAKTAARSRVWGGNQGRTITLNVDPTNFPAQFGAPGSVLFRNPSLPSRAAPTTPSFPLAVAAGNSVTDFDPNLKTGYVQSWDIGIPARTDARHGARSPLRRQPRHATCGAQVNINEINIFEQRLPQRVQDRAEQPGHRARLRRARPGLHVRQPQQSNSTSACRDSSRCPMIFDRARQPTTTPPPRCRSSRDRPARWPTASPPTPPAWRA